MGDRVLREPCDHGRYESCDELITNGVPISPAGVKHPVFSWKPCPGGREVTIDYEAAAGVIAKRFSGMAEDAMGRDLEPDNCIEDAHLAIDAALPDLVV